MGENPNCLRIIPFTNYKSDVKDPNAFPPLRVKDVLGLQYDSFGCDGLREMLLPELDGGDDRSEVSQGL